MGHQSRETLFGNVPDKSPIALILIDVINDFAFDGSAPLLRQAIPMAKRLANLKARATEHGCATIYVNDNFGRWRSDFKSQVRHCLGADVPGRSIAELLRPSSDDYFVLKPAHSGFYGTALELLLAQLQTKILILTGVATNSCVLFTANDAYLRGYKICIPPDCVAANSAKLSAQAIKQMETVSKADIRSSKHLPWERWLN